MPKSAAPSWCAPLLALLGHRLRALHKPTITTNHHQSSLPSTPQRAAEGKAGRRQEIGVTASLLTASLAGCGNVLLTNPIWLVVTRMQTHAQPTSALSVVRSICEEDGIAALWRVRLPKAAPVAAMQGPRRRAALVGLSVLV